jgi:hypothetical protein
MKINGTDLTREQLNQIIIINSLFKSITDYKKEGDLNYISSIYINFPDTLCVSVDINNVLTTLINSTCSVILKPIIIHSLEWPYCTIIFEQKANTSFISKAPIRLEKKVYSNFNDILSGIISFLKQEEFELYIFNKLKEFQNKK